MTLSLGRDDDMWEPERYDKALDTGSIETEIEQAASVYHLVKLDKDVWDEGTLRLIRSLGCQEADSLSLFVSPQQWVAPKIPDPHFGPGIDWTHIQDR